MSFARYSTYRQSGVDVIGVVPAHWEVRPLRQLGRLLKGIGGSKEDVVPEGVPCVRYGDLYTTHAEAIERARTFLTEDRAGAYTSIKYGDVLFAASGEKIDEIGKSGVNLIRGDARCGGDLIVLRPTVPMVPRFLGYAADAWPSVAQKTSMGRGTTVKHIYPDELRNLIVAVPPIQEQHSIADFLDRKTAVIDELVAKKERLVVLLAEKRQALITQAVIKGLDPNVPTKESRVEWLSRIPTTWSVARIGHLSRVTNGSTPDRAERDYWTDGSIPWLSSGKVNDYIVREADEFRTLRALRECPLQMLPAQTVLVGMIGQGKTRGMSAITSLAACINQNVAGIVARSRLRPRFLLHVLTAAYVPLREFGRGGQQDALNCEIIRAFRVPVPPLDEQDVVLRWVEKETLSIDSMRARLSESIDRLREYRQALITAAVTGKLDLERAGSQTDDRVEQVAEGA